MQPKIYTARQHQIKEEHIDRDALYVLAKLHQAGYTAYLVGGSVRDLLMGLTPKDVDISTSAKPEEIKQLFSNCLLIGRRFRLAHIRFGKKILEVSTFRAGDNADAELITRDNEWGSPEEDVLRRDFTINGLFYDPKEHIVIDYVGGLSDLSKHLLKTIGKPETRFKQDPVRMIRLLKFCARFGFNVDPDSERALHHCKNELQKSSPARVLEEFLKMLESGASAPFVKLLEVCGFLKLLLPRLDKFLHTKNSSLVYAYLEATDKLIRQDKKSIPDRSVLLCNLLFPILEEAVNHYMQTNDGIAPHITDILSMTDLLLEELSSSAFFPMPRRLKTLAHFILNAQFRLLPPSHRKPSRYRITRHPDFPFALRFLALRATVHPELQNEYLEWKQIAKERPKPPPRRPV